MHNSTWSLGGIGRKQWDMNTILLWAYAITITGFGEKKSEAKKKSLKN
jgi:hypothetical protein